MGSSQHSLHGSNCRLCSVHTPGLVHSGSSREAAHAILMSKTQASHREAQPCSALHSQMAVQQSLFPVCRDSLLTGKRDYYSSQNRGDCTELAGICGEPRLFDSSSLAAPPADKHSVPAAPRWCACPCSDGIYDSVPKVPFFSGKNWIYKDESYKLENSKSSSSSGEC